jgi:glycosyltransferase involved in cell wall biosynthesis
VLDRLARRYGPADVYTLVTRPESLSDAIGRCRVVTSPLQRWPGAAGRLRRWYLPLMPWAVGRIEVAPCDLLISTSSAVIKALRPPPGAPHLCYCHSPARYLWEQTDDYAVGSGGRVRHLALRRAAGPFQRWDRRTCAGVTRFLANSRHTARRIERCYGREASVVYPPIDTDFFSPDPAVSRQDWLLLVAALEPYKRTDLPVEAANRGRLRLRIVGTGSQEAVLRKMAGPTVEFLGRVDALTLRKLYRGAAALVHPQVEDFGMAAVEAQATGCPVIALNAGGAAETVTRATGVLFEGQRVDALLDAVRFLQHRAFDPQACRDNADRFGADRFDRAIQRHVEDLLNAGERPVPVVLPASRALHTGH